MRRTVSGASWFIVFAVACLCSVASSDSGELIYAALFGAAGAFLTAALHRFDRRTFAPRTRALFTIATRAATGAVSETWLLFGPQLFAQLTGRALGGRFIRIAIDLGDDDPRHAGRVACVLWASSFTPNAIPLFIDRAQLVLTSSCRVVSRTHTI